MRVMILISGLSLETRRGPGGGSEVADTEDTMRRTLIGAVMTALVVAGGRYLSPAAEAEAVVAAAPVVSGSR